MGEHCTRTLSLTAQKVRGPLVCLMGEAFKYPHFLCGCALISFLVCVSSPFPVLSFFISPPIPFTTPLCFTGIRSFFIYVCVCLIKPSITELKWKESSRNFIHLPPPHYYFSFYTSSFNSSTASHFRPLF